MSLAVATRPRLRFSGRSFLAFVIEPVPPLSEWLNALDDISRQSIGFFANRPVIVDLSALKPDKDETATVIEAIKTRGIRVVAVEGVNPAWIDPALAPLARGMESAKIIDFIENGDRTGPDGETPDGPPPTSKIIDKPVRSGQSIFHAGGDLTIIGSVSSGAEVVAAGSIHIYGALRGRALAGAMGDAEARILCRKFEAELLAIDGSYLTAEQTPAALIGKPVQVRLDGDAIEIKEID